ncbi:MAG: hypothetical protein FWG10_05675 [Eubacteriaceae bacterium]|nr:hypothetical protein [Eubacteriaceae bacterium]
MTFILISGISFAALAVMMAVVFYVAYPKTQKYLFSQLVKSVETTDPVTFVELFHPELQSNVDGEAYKDNLTEFFMRFHDRLERDFGAGYKISGYKIDFNEKYEPSFIDSINSMLDITIESMESMEVSFNVSADGNEAVEMTANLTLVKIAGKWRLLDITFSEASLGICC